MNQTRENLSLGEAARRLGVTPTTARRMVRSGSLAGAFVLPGGHVRIPAAAIEEIIARGREALAQRPEEAA